MKILLGKPISSRNNMDILRRHRVEFVENLHSVSFVIDHLFSVGVLTIYNKSTIESHRNPHDQTRELLDIMTCKGPEKLESFYKALMATDNAGLAKLIESRPSRKTVKIEKRSSVQSQETETKLNKVLILERNDAQNYDKIKEYIPSADEDSCTQLIKKIKDAGNESFDNLVIFILGDFDGDKVQDIMSPDKKYYISEISVALKSIQPVKKIMCVLLQKEENKSSPMQLDSNKMLVVLTEDRLLELLNKFRNAPTDDVYSFFTHLIKDNENIIPVPPAPDGYILLLQGCDENKEVGDFLCKQNKNMNFEYKSDSCTCIKRKLNDAKPFETSRYFVVFFLSQFNGTEVKDICSADGVHISHICDTLKEMLPKTNKICIFLQENDVKPKPIIIEKGSHSILFVSLTKGRLIQLMEKLNDCTDDIPVCITNFVSNEEKIW